MQPHAQVQATIDVLAEAEKRQLPVDRVMAHYFRNNRYIGGKDKKAIAETVYGMLRQQGLIDWGLTELGLNQTPRLRVAAWLHLEGKVVEGLFSGEKFAPAKLSSEELGVKDISAKKKYAPKHAELNYPAWAGGLLIKAFEENLEAAMHAMNKQAQTDLRLNTLKGDMNTLKETLKGEGAAFDDTPLSGVGIRLKASMNVFGLKAFKAGVFEVQDAGSQVLAALCDVKPGQKVTDYCAGAGGKTLALAARMGNKGVLTSGDIIEPKLKELKKRLKRAGVDNTQTQLWPKEGKNTWLKRHKATQDVVLLDVPCSGSGVWRRNPDAKWVLNEQRLQELCDIQRQILQQASALTAEGGRLVYATCSVFEEENEAQIRRFLSETKDFKIVPIERVWAEGVEAGTLKGPCPTKEKTLRLAPHTTQTDGFFVAVLERV